MKEKFAIFLKKKKLRGTSQRDLILDVFLQTKHHVSAEDLLNLVLKEQLNRTNNTGSIGIATVYRTVKLFVEAEIATERHFEDDITRYEIRIEGEHHDHLICLNCNHIFEFEDEIIERQQVLVAKSFGMKIHSHRLEIYAHGCSKCNQ
jgi:Fur family transcriptional regulator, ferric uptake regulator